MSEMTMHIDKRRMVPIQERWICPENGCGGEMKFNGHVWATCPERYHHTCDKCGFRSVVPEVMYPRIVYVSDAKLNGAEIERTLKDAGVEV